MRLYNIDINQRFSNWVPRKLRTPQIGVRCSERRKCVKAEEFYW